MPDTSGFNRRRFFTAAAATVAAGPLDVFGLSTRNNAMAITLTESTQQTGTDKASIRPFSVPTVSDADLADIYAYLQSIPKPPDVKSLPQLNP